MTEKQKATARYQACLRYALGTIDHEVFKQILHYTNPFKGNKNNRYSK